MRTCYTCKTDKPLIEYYTHKETGYRYDCKACCKLKVAEWRKANPGKARASRRAANNKWYAKNPDKAKNGGLIRNYGIELKEYQRMLKEQNDCCAICKGTEVRSLAVDYCHATGKIRGLLCSKCNTGLGQFRDNIEYLTLASSYLLRNL